MQGGKVFRKASRQKELNDSAAVSTKMGTVRIDTKPAEAIPLRLLGA